MTTHKRLVQRGFTLVEMLVVMAIIAILAAILLPAIRAAVTAAKNNRIAQELSSLHQSVEAYKQKYGDYPPDFSSVTAVADLLSSSNVAGRHLRKAFPRHKETAATLATVFPNNKFPDPSEALVFWLTQLKDDQLLPLSSTTGAKLAPLFTFDESRGVDLDSDTWYSYVPKDGKDMPYVYFDSRTYKFKVGATDKYSSFTYNGVNVCPYGTSVTADYANPKTYQIICAGLDGDYGTTTLGTPPTYKFFPAGTNYVLGDMDNITNFSEGKILEDHMP